jgi:hypothetical protein
MAWFYYCGPTTTPIGLGKGESVAVRPHSYVEVPDNAANSMDVMRLMARGLLRRSGVPAHARVKEEAQVVAPAPAPAPAPVAAPEPKPKSVEEPKESEPSLLEVEAESDVQQKAKRRRKRRKPSEVSDTESGASEE